MTEESPDFGRLEVLLGYRFRARELLREALTHASRAEVHNERLEFLGDAVLNLVVAEELYRRFPGEREGRLTVLKSRVVAREALERAADRLGLAAWLRTGGSFAGRRTLPRSLPGNALEALLGAIFLDSPPQNALRSAAAVALRCLQPELERLAEDSERAAAKEALQLHAQRVFGVVPTYRVVGTYAHPLGTSFQVAAEIAGRAFPPAWGSSKKEAERWAAWEALLLLRAEGALGPADAAR